MGQVVVNCEEAMDFVKVQDSENEETQGGSSSIAGWDLSNPLRVLLVEADDSTGQIIGALLRKCNYKVASVSDGLKTWEFLKTRHDSIDLVLTEVDLPSISGYALLTLISEHEICKNIPVIMMSTQYSVKMVYKCLVKGAADFLVKPIRINELRNLWRHVWRRTYSYKTEEKSRVFDLKIQDYSNCDNSNQNIYAEASKDAIDLMGNFDDRRDCYSNVGSTRELDCSQRLDLSLRRYQPDENRMLNHANTSAFTQYFDDSNAKDTDNISDSNTISHSMCFEKNAENHALHRLFSAKSFSRSPRISSDQPISAKEQRLESSEDGSQFTTQADQSNASDAVVPGVSDSGSEPLYYKRSIQREAALTKFRLKRKERCFDKKVRYESRKTLAEQRPRVKGQFVRHAPTTNRV